MNSIFNKRVNLYSLLAIAGVLVLAFFSGWRDVGIDRENYLEMHAGILSSDDIAEKFFFAKDIVFLLASDLTSYLSDDARWVFLLVCFLSVMAKYFAVKKIAPQYLLPFLIAYAVFLSPGLEFAAMRGGLAIGFLMLALAYNHRFFLFSLFSLLTVASHMALLPVVLLAYRPVNELLARHKLGYVAVAITTLLAAASLIALFPHGLDYEDNQGSLFAYALPVATLLVSNFVFYQFDSATSAQKREPAFQFVEIAKPVIYGLIAIAFGISGLIVTASTRYLEISWCLLLLAALILCGKYVWSLVGLLMLIAFLSYLNVYRLTWMEILAPSVVTPDEPEVSWRQPPENSFSAPGPAPRYADMGLEFRAIRALQDIGNA
jgi:hypothetical protein